MDYNKAGEQYVQYVFGSDNPTFGALTVQAREHLAALTALVLERRSQATNADRESWSRLEAALERLNAIHLYSRRIGDGVASLPLEISKGLTRIRQAQTDGHPVVVDDFTPPMMLFSRMPEVLADFESLLFHATSVLDVLAKFYVAETTGQIPSTLYFSGSEKLIYATQPPDIRADYTWQDVTSAQAALSNVLTGQDGFPGIRNVLMHRSSIDAITKSGFVLHWLEPNKVLCVDHEIVSRKTNPPDERLFPLSATARLVSRTVCWLVARVAAHYLGRTRQGGLLSNYQRYFNAPESLFEPAWANIAVNLREFVDPQGTEKVSVTRADSTSSTIETLTVKRDIYGLAVTV